ncbi:hypothetical protein AK812_SmicGene3182 [Symbiodinium microadriaticum]|uniref:Uncharacterized protein n=1 Tax=Symbiodinium microadriaticum TaxID=2951 RepID=A0A1Q9EZD2_SYMMI|nr:hypothetical protein AK812_SmicGene3182 [Symbiodinium microadriaticum]
MSGRMQPDLDLQAKAEKEKQSSSKTAEGKLQQAVAEKDAAEKKLAEMRTQHDKEKAEAAQAAKEQRQKLSESQEQVLKEKDKDLKSLREEGEGLRKQLAEREKQLRAVTEQIAGINGSWAEHVEELHAQYRREKVFTVVVDIIVRLTDFSIRGLSASPAGGPGIPPTRRSWTTSDGSIRRRTPLRRSAVCGWNWSRLELTRSILLICSCTPGQHMLLASSKTARMNGAQTLQRDRGGLASLRLRLTQLHCWRRSVSPASCPHLRTENGRANSATAWM